MSDESRIAQAEHDEEVIEEYKQKVRKAIDKLEIAEDSCVDEASDEVFINSTELKKRLNL